MRIHMHNYRGSYENNNSTTSFDYAMAAVANQMRITVLKHLYKVF